MKLPKLDKEFWVDSFAPSLSSSSSLLAALRMNGCCKAFSAVGLLPTSFFKIVVIKSLASSEIVSQIGSENVT